MCKQTRALAFYTEGPEPIQWHHVHSETNNRTPMHNYTPLAESDSTEASTMHGVRLAVACGIQCEHSSGSLKVRGVRITAECIHTPFFKWRAAVEVISASNDSRVDGSIGACYKPAFWGQQSSAKVAERRVTHQAAKVALEFGVVPRCTHSKCGSISDWRPPREWGVGCTQLYTSIHAKHQRLSTEIGVAAYHELDDKHKITASTRVGRLRLC